MKTKKEKYRIIWDGFYSAFDLFGEGFRRKRRSNNIENSWHNVGIFFSRGFDDYMQLKQNCDNSNEKRLTKQKHLKRKLQFY